VITHVGTMLGTGSMLYIPFGMTYDPVSGVVAELRDVPAADLVRASDGGQLLDEVVAVDPAVKVVNEPPVDDAVVVAEAPRSTVGKVATGDGARDSLAHDENPSASAVLERAVADVLAIFPGSALIDEPGEDAEFDRSLTMRHNPPGTNENGEPMPFCSRRSSTTGRSVKPAVDERDRA
jgi:hypothetical protein